MDKAIALLPLELRPLFEKNRAMVVERAIDPDTWRTAGFAEEPPNHFLDIDWEGYGKYPFTALPRSYDEAVAKFGKDRIMQEVHAAVADRRDVRQPAARLRVARARQHASRRWTSCFCQRRWRTTFRMRTYRCTGSATTTASCRDRTGVHNRWESTMFERYRTRLTIAPKPVPPIATPRDFVFDRVLEDAQLVPALLKGDADAIGNRDAVLTTRLRRFFQRAATRHGGSAR